MDALDYLTNIRIAPNGELLDKSEKLTLILLALEQDGAGYSQPDIDRLADKVLVNRRSMFRILANLERMRAVESFPQTIQTGQSARTKYTLLDDKGRVLYVTPSGGARVLPMTPQSVTERGEGVTHDTLESVTRNTLAPTANSSNSNGLRAVPSGTPFASPNTPNSPIGEGSGEGVTGNTLGEQVTAVSLWFEIIGTPNNLPLSPNQIAFISSRVTNLAAWRYTLQGWAANERWRKDNITGQVERYETKTLCLPQFQSSAPSPSPEAVQAETEADARYHRQVYGDQK